MFEQLQEALDQFQAQQEEIDGLRTKLLEKNIIIDGKDKQIEELEAKALANHKTEQIASKAIGLTNLNAKLMYSLEQEKQKSAKLTKELAELKGGANPKKLKEQVIRTKEKNKELQRGNDQLKEQNRKYRLEHVTLRKELKDSLLRNQQLSLTQVFAEDGHELWLVPHKLGMDRGNGNEKILVLLHLAPNGIGYLVTCLNGEISLDKDVLEKDLPAMPQAMYEHAEAWLSKVEAQGYSVTDADLMALGGFQDLNDEEIL
ncbi:TPA: hypothetical protein ACRZZI_004943 [Vibrio harveyi]